MHENQERKKNELTTTNFWINDTRKKIYSGKHKQPNKQAQTDKIDEI